jgi:tetratricopeptide (TPR) repeat protein
MHFQRFTIDDEVLLKAQVAAAEEAFSVARGSGDKPVQLRSAIALANMLIAARREREATGILASVERLARTETTEALGWWLLYFGTAEQYLDDRSSAQQRFNEALRLAQDLRLRSLESYVLHHMGRCYVEDGEIDLARAAFQQALELREALDDPRKASTRRALDALVAEG